jgi:phosphoribosylformylglycinamidine (FGAM) synthase-like amidotransferase family enzyme
VEVPGALAASAAEIAIRYLEDVNGSLDRAAALSAVDGRILGLMPHPEAAFYRFNHPDWTRDPGAALSRGPGAALFQNLATALTRGGS